MITIVKGNEKIVCTKGIFEEQYKSLGYQIASKNKEATNKVASSVLKEEANNEEKTLKDLQEEEIKSEEKISEKYGLKKNTKKGK